MNLANLSTIKPVLPATHSLLAEISGNANYHIINAYKNAVLFFGSTADVDEVLKHFFKNPTEPFADALLEIIGRWGIESHAEKIFKFSFEDGLLHEDYPEKVLEVLGQLTYEPAKPVLARHAFNAPEYYLNKAAVLGLLNFDCKEYQEQIRINITQILDKNLFPEYLPALVCKLEDKEELLEKLYISGSTIASTDCNAGIFLGFSLCGEEGKIYFKKALLDPGWEAYYNAASTVLQGLEHLGITFLELLHEANHVRNEKDLQYYMLVIISLLEKKAAFNDPKGESFEEIYRQAISTQIFSTLAERAGLLADAQKVEELLIFRMKEEVLLRSKN